MTTYLSAKHISEAYNGTFALKDVSLDVRGGEILALLGSNGAGKTTLIKILATLLNRDGGSVTILGYDIDTDAELVRHLFGYVGQDTERSAYARLSVRDNLRFFGALRGLNKREVDRRLRKLADYFDFQAHLDKHFMTLSGGQKQTAVIMRALLYDPPLVYLDEPTKGLDPLVARNIRSFLKQYAREENKALLLTSHILSEVDELADRVALLHNGVIPVSGTPAELKQALGVQGFVELRKDALPPHVQAEILRCAPVVVGVEREPGWISFGIAHTLDGTEAIIKVLRAHYVQAELRYSMLSLEDAFVHHIGVLAQQGAEEQPSYAD